MAIYKLTLDLSTVVIKKKSKQILRNPTSRKSGHLVDNHIFLPI